MTYERTNQHALRGDVERALRTCALFPASVRIDGTLKRLGGEFHERTFAFWIEADPALPETRQTAHVVRTLSPEHADGSIAAAREQLRREARTLQTLAALQAECDAPARDALGFDAPHFVCFLGDASRPSGLIETAVLGAPLEMFGYNEINRPVMLETVARAAAAVHRLPVASFAFLPAHADARAHVRAQLDEVASKMPAGDPEAAAVRDWIMAHLPAECPAAVLHGDLLPQNLLHELETDRFGIVDWEFARIGDPAYDLAILSRGNRKTLGKPDGFAQLLETYHAAGGAPVTRSDVLNHELLMVLHWLADALREYARRSGSGQRPEYYREQLRALLRRAPGLAQRADRV